VFQRRGALVWAKHEKGSPFRVQKNHQLLQWNSSQPWEGFAEKTTPFSVRKKTPSKRRLWGGEGPRREGNVSSPLWGESLRRRGPENGGFFPLERSLLPGPKEREESFLHHTIEWGTIGGGGKRESFPSRERDPFQRRGRGSNAGVGGEKLLFRKVLLLRFISDQGEAIREGLRSPPGGSI